MLTRKTIITDLPQPRGLQRVAVSRQNAGAQDGSVLHFAVTDVGLGEPRAVLGVRLREVFPGGASPPMTRTSGVTPAQTAVAHALL
jgi:hypothetical protein